MVPRYFIQVLEKTQQSMCLMVAGFLELQLQVRILMNAEPDHIKRSRQLIGPMDFIERTLAGVLLITKINDVFI